MARDGGVYYLSEIIRVRKSAGELNKLIVQTAVLDGPGVVIREEQEPGSSGAAVIEMRKNALAGFNYRGIKADKAKVLRWQPMFGQAEVGNVKLVSDAPAEKKWIAEFLDEVTAAPYGAHDDQLDAVAGAFTCLALENQASLAAAAMYPLFY